MSKGHQVLGVFFYGLLLAAGLVGFLVASVSVPLRFGPYVILVFFLLTLCGVVGVVPLWLVLRMGRRPRWWKGALISPLSVATTFLFMKLLSYAVGAVQGLTWANVVQGPWLVGIWLVLPGALLALWIGRWRRASPDNIADTFD